MGGITGAELQDAEAWIEWSAAPALIDVDATRSEHNWMALRLVYTGLLEHPRMGAFVPRWLVDLAPRLLEAGYTIREAEDVVGWALGAPTREAQRERGMSLLGLFGLEATRMRLDAFVAANP